MRLIKRLLFFVLILIIASGLIYWADLRGLITIDNKIFKNIKKEFAQIQNNDSITNFTNDAQNQSKILSERAKEAGSHLQQVLGESVQVNEDAQKESLHQRAFDYGRYLYCKTVVEDYESQNQTNN